MVDLNDEQLQNLASEIGMSAEALKKILPSIADYQTFTQMVAQGLRMDLKQWFILKRRMQHQHLSRWAQHDEAVVKQWTYPETEKVIAVLQNPNQVVEGLEGVYSGLLSLHPDILTNMRAELIDKAEVVLHLPKHPTPVHLALQHDWKQAKRHFNSLDPYLVARFFQSKSSQLQLEFLHPQGAGWALDFLSKYFAWSHQGRAADDWIQASFVKLAQSLILPILHRDLLAFLYDKMVEAHLELLILKLGQILQFQGIGEKQCLLLYPHGRSGVMALVMDAQGQELDHLVFYPHAPDYDAEASLADLAKLMIKYHLSALALVQKPETNKLLQKLLLRLKARYSDVSWQLHMIPGELTKLLTMKAVKHPCIEDVLQIAGFVQNPSAYWSNINLASYLEDLALFIPQAVYQNLWQMLMVSDEKPCIQIFDTLGLEKSALGGIKAGTMFRAIVGTVVNYGVFLEIAPGIEGLLHVSNMGKTRPCDLSTCFKTGDSLMVAWHHYDEKTKRIALRLGKNPEQQQQRKNKVVKKPMVKAEATKLKPQVTGAMQMAFAKLKQQNE